MSTYFYGSEPHYLEHMLPIQKEMNEASCGSQLKASDVTVVSSYSDLIRVRSFNFDTKIVYMEHGAGQTYNGLNKAQQNYYPGGERQSVSLIMVPGPFARTAYEKSTQKIPIIEIGCPKLTNQPKWNQIRQDNKIRVLLIFHWDCKICPETEETYTFWIPNFRNIFYSYPQFEFFYTRHPRQTNTFDNELVDSKFKIWNDERIDLVLCDNSSMGIELALLDYPVIWLNGPKYRLNANHGLRFRLEGQHIFDDESNNLIQTIKDAILNSHQVKKANQALIKAAYSNQTNGIQLAIREIRKLNK